MLRTTKRFVAAALALAALAVAGAHAAKAQDFHFVKGGAEALNFTKASDALALNFTRAQQ
jgi:hypothetical protein